MEREEREREAKWNTETSWEEGDANGFVYRRRWRGRERAQDNILGWKSRVETVEYLLLENRKKETRKENCWRMKMMRLPFLKAADKKVHNLEDVMDLHRVKVLLCCCCCWCWCWCCSSCCWVTLSSFKLKVKVEVASAPVVVSRTLSSSVLSIDTWCVCFIAGNADIGYGPSTSPGI